MSCVFKIRAEGERREKDGRIVRWMVMGRDRGRTAEEEKVTWSEREFLFVVPLIFFFLP